MPLTIISLDFNLLLASEGKYRYIAINLTTEVIPFAQYTISQVTAFEKGLDIVIGIFFFGLYNTKLRLYDIRSYR